MRSLTFEKGKLYNFVFTVDFYLTVNDWFGLLGFMAYQPL